MKPSQLKEFDRVLLAILFVIMVVIAIRAPSERVFDLASDCASGILGALVVLISQHRIRADSSSPASRSST